MGHGGTPLQGLPLLRPRRVALFVVWAPHTKCWAHSKPQGHARLPTAHPPRAMGPALGLGGQGGALNCLAKPPQSFESTLPAQSARLPFVQGQMRTDLPSSPLTHTASHLTLCKGWVWWQVSLREMALPDTGQREPEEKAEERRPSSWDSSIPGSRVFNRLTRWPVDLGETGPHTPLSPCCPGSSRRSPLLGAGPRFAGRPVGPLRRGLLVQEAP